MAQLSHDEAAPLAAALETAEAWLQSSRKSATAEEIQEQRKHVEDIANPIVTQMYSRRRRARGEVAAEGEGNIGEHDEDDVDEMYDEDL
eukprot:TRINITY_DN94265_c0_g1_i1.p2 TRINITY_DN94265_c0_g1~~TRINITY_DN94265_c0_g1_i1.p2  ORF type:complete len:103 (+),score=34.59 TRINITY_DN94265_c0_g1_i1:43-309(+)